MLTTVTKRKYYKVSYWNNDVIVDRVFPMRRGMIEFINVIGRNKVVDIAFIRELDLEEVE